MNDERVPFEVHEPVEVGDLTEVQDRTVMPASDNVLFTIQKAHIQLSFDKSVKNLHLELKVAEGIDEQGKYRGMVLFENVPIWADFSNERIASSPYYQQKRYLVQMKFLTRALGCDLKSPPMVTDEFCAGLAGQHIRANITTEHERTFEQSTGEWVDTGTLRNRVKAFKPV